MSDPFDLQTRMLAAAPDLDLRFRKMFGGIMGYAGGTVFASLSNVGLALKFNGTAHPNMLAVPGAVPLRYEPGDPPSKSYIVLPPDIVADNAALHECIVASIDGLKPKPAKR